MTRINIDSNVGAEETRRQQKLKRANLRLRLRRKNHRRRSAGWVPAVAAAAAPLLMIGIAAAADGLPDADPAQANPFQPLLDGLIGKYGWMTSVVLVIGSLRVLFKPVMLAIEK